MSPLPLADLLTLDRRHVWHPYAPMPNPGPVFPVERAAGVYLHLATGEQVIDGMSSWWTCIHGYNHPRLNQAAQDQMGRMAHVMFGGLTHQPGVQLAQRLIELTPAPLQQVFFCDSGSVAVEVAMKMAIQYWHSQGQPQKQHFLTLRRGYHGDTFAAMAVCDPVNGMHHLFRNSLVEQYFADAPQIPFEGSWHDDDIASFAAILEHNHDTLAAAIFEPVLQGAGGMRSYSPTYVQRARELCDAHGVLLILDEIATGFGRTGELFACHHAGVCPDIMAVGKALTGGMMSLAATLTTPHISHTLTAGEAGAFMHGPTFMGNPLACAIALENLDLLTSYDWAARVRAIEAQLKRELNPCHALPGVRDVRVLGAVGVLELEHPVDLAVVQPQLVAQGVWLRPFGRLLYTMPPYIITPEQLRTVTQAMVAVAAAAA